MMKKIIYIGLSILIIVFLVIAVFLNIHKDNDNKKINFKSNFGKVMDSDTFEVKDTEVINENGNIRLIIKLHNKSNKDIDSFYIEIVLIDSNENELYRISTTSSDDIMRNSTFRFNYSVLGEKGLNRVVDAKVVALQKHVFPEIESLPQSVKK